MPPKDAPAVKPADAWFAAKHPPLWQHNAAKAMKRWDEHFTVDEATYDAALAEVAQLTLR